VSFFGHVKGAFTGAVSDRVGRFETADKGTIFLDEIAETSENFQVKLLRVLQTGDFEKVGSSKTEHVNLRIIAATNKNLETEVREKKFREDLYYRLNVIKMELPPLRNRKDDIEVLIDYFVKKEANEFRISRSVYKSLKEYQWKGNVQELEAVIKRACIFAKSSRRELI
jgi:transcriptional regulator with GAF, ATPase, and Fis domain